MTVGAHDRCLESFDRERIWTNDGVADAEQFSCWTDIVSTSFCPVSISRSTEGGFASQVVTRAVGPMLVARLTAPAQSVRRTASQVSRDAGDVYFLNLPLNGGTLAGQDGRACRLQPGDFVLVDSSRPFELGFADSVAQISLSVPHDLLAPRLHDPGAVTARRVVGSQGVGAVASAAIRALASNGSSVDTHLGQAVSEQVAGLIALALGSVRGRPATIGSELLLRGAMDEAERRIGEPELSPADVAARIGVSTRYLHRLFAQAGTSFGRWLLECRLQRCHVDLADPALAAVPIGDLAARHGFRDQSYFARAFRRRHGHSPSEARRRARAAG